MALVQIQLVQENNGFLHRELRFRFKIYGVLHRELLVWEGGETRWQFRWNL